MNRCYQSSGPAQDLQAHGQDNRMARMHDDTETISEKLAYCKHISDSEFETREVLELETSNQNIEHIGTRLYKTRLDDNQITRSMDSSKRSENHEPEVNSDPEPSSSGLSESSSSNLSARGESAQRRKSVVSIRKINHPTHLRAMILIRQMTVIIDINNTKIRNTG